MRRIVWLVLALGLATPAFARGRYNGICAQSGTVQFGTVGPSSNTGAITYPLSTVTVYASDGVTPAVIYQDNSGTLKSNPFANGSDATFYFYADNGTYNIQCSGTGITTPFTYAGAGILDPNTSSLSVSPPSYSVQIAGPVSGLASDPYVLVNTTLHSLDAPVIDGMYNAASTFWGATPTSDIGPNVNAAFAVAKNTGAKVLIPAATCWTVNTTIQFPTGTPNLHLTGDQQGGSCLTAGGSLGNHPVVEVGTIGDSTTTTGVHISYLSISNGTPAASGPTVGTKYMSGIRMEQCTNCEVDHTYISSIAGNHGIAAKYGSNIRIHDNWVKNYTYIGIAAISNIDNFRIQNNTVDMAPLVSVYVNAYGIVSGEYEGSGDGAFFPTNGVISDNYVANIVNWQGINMHGGEHVTIRDNKILNVKSGIFIALADTAPTVSSPAMNDIHVSGNSVQQGTGAADGIGINLQGGSTPTLAHGMWVTDNSVYGFGATATASAFTIGSIETEWVQDFHVVGNRCFQYNQQCILLNVWSFNGEVKNNTAGDLLDAYNRAVSAVVASNTGVWGISVDGNCSEPNTAAVMPQYLLNSFPTTPTSNFILGSNNCATGVAKTVFRGNLPAGFTSAPTSGSGKLQLVDGTQFYDANNRAAWVANCSSNSVPVAPTIGATLSGSSVNAITLSGGSGWPASSTIYLPIEAFYGGGGAGASGYFTTNGSGVPVSPGTVVTGGTGYGSAPTVNAPIGVTGYCSLNTDTIANGTVAQFSTSVGTITGGASSPLWYYWFPPGVNISIAGAGPGGAALKAKVIANDWTTLTIDQPAATAVSGAAITYAQAATPSPVITLQGGTQRAASVAQQWQDWQTTFPALPNAAQGAQICNIDSSPSGSCIGFGYSNDAPFMAVNAMQVTAGVDLWHQVNSAAASWLCRLTSTQPECFVAASSSADAVFATFWGATARTALGTNGSFTGTITGTRGIFTQSTGTAPITVSSTTPVPNLNTAPIIYNAAGTQLVSGHIVIGGCTLGTNCAVTLSGSAVFTSNSSYLCAATDETAANAAKWVPSSGSAFTLTGTGTDTLSYVCAGI